MERPAMRDDSVDKLLSVCIFHLPPTPAGALSLVGEFLFFETNQILSPRYWGSLNHYCLFCATRMGEKKIMIMLRDI